jgi:3-isopropylmalate dehydratase small subunit
MQNIDTDQIIPAEYLTLVPSKVGHGQQLPALLPALFASISYRRDYAWCSAITTTQA